MKCCMQSKDTRTVSRMRGMRLSEEEVSRHASEGQIVSLKGRTVPGTVWRDDNFITVYIYILCGVMYAFVSRVYEYDMR